MCHQRASSCDATRADSAERQQLLHESAQVQLSNCIIFSGEKLLSFLNVFYGRPEQHSRVQSYYP